MNKYEAKLIHSHMFNPSFIQEQDYVVRQEPNGMIDQYHACLMDCPRPLLYLKETVGLGVETIKAHQIGYVDNAKFDSHMALVEESRSANNSLCKCFTLPLFNGFGLSGIYGLRYNSKGCTAGAESFVNYSRTPIYSPFLKHKTALLCDNPFVVLALNEMGYRDGIAILGESVSYMALAAMREQNVERLLVFTHALTELEEINEAQVIAKSYGISLVNVVLPFQVKNLGKWDSYQWRLFALRLASNASETGGYDERLNA